MGDLEILMRVRDDLQLSKESTIITLVEIRYVS